MTGIRPSRITIDEVDDDDELEKLTSCPFLSNKKRCSSCFYKLELYRCQSEHLRYIPLYPFAGLEDKEKIDKEFDDLQKNIAEKFNQEVVQNLIPGKQEVHMTERISALDNTEREQHILKALYINFKIDELWLFIHRLSVILLYADNANKDGSSLYEVAKISYNEVRNVK
jgi:hypothetical protein